MFKERVQRVAGAWTAEYRWGKVMEMLVKMMEVLMKIAVMMMAPGGVSAPPEARGESPPSSYSSLTFSLDGRRVPLWSMASMAWEGREPLRDWIYLSVSLCFCALGFCPFTVSYISEDP